jgi:hypothetical protein
LEDLVAAVVLRVIPRDLENGTLANGAARRRRLKRRRHFHRAEALVRQCDNPLRGEDVGTAAYGRLSVRHDQVVALLVRVRVRVRARVRVKVRVGVRVRPGSGVPSV